jgi:hypothetical protein
MYTKVENRDTFVPTAPDRDIDPVGAMSVVVLSGRLSNIIGRVSGMKIQ